MPQSTLNLIRSPSNDGTPYSHQTQKKPKAGRFRGLSAPRPRHSDRFNNAGILKTLLYLYALFPMLAKSSAGSSALSSESVTSPNFPQGLPCNMYSRLQSIRVEGESLTVEEIKPLITDQDGNPDLKGMDRYMARSSWSEYYKAINGFSWCGIGNDDELVNCIDEKMKSIGGGILYIWNSMTNVRSPDKTQADGISIARLAFQKKVGNYLQKNIYHPIILMATMNKIPDLYYVPAMNIKDIENKDFINIVFVNERFFAYDSHLGDCGSSARKPNIAKTIFHESFHCYASPRYKFKMFNDLKSEITALILEVEHNIKKHNTQQIVDNIDELITELLASELWTEDRADYDYETQRVQIGQFGNIGLKGNDFGKHLLSTIQNIADQEKTKSMKTFFLESEKNKDFYSGEFLLGMHVLCGAYLSGEDNSIEVLQKAIITMFKQAYFNPEIFDKYKKYHMSEKHDEL